MNPGAVESGEKVTTAAIEALKSTPVVLAILIFNIIWLAVITYSSLKTGERWERVVNATLRTCTGVEGKDDARMKLQSDESYPIELPPLPQPRPQEADK